MQIFIFTIQFIQERYRSFLKSTLVACFILSSSLVAHTQDSSSVLKEPGEYLSAIEKRINGLDKKLDKSTERLLCRMEKEEMKLFRKLSRKDSSKANIGMEEAKNKYAALRSQLQVPEKLKKMPYNPFLDTLKSSLGFLEGKMPDMNINEVSGSIQRLEDRFRQAEHVKGFLKERKTQLKTMFGEAGMIKRLKNVNKQAYYYSAQIGEYKKLLSDRKKMEQKALSLLKEQPAFKNFMNKHSELASLFRLPGSANGAGIDPNSVASLQGLQTRASVAAQVRQQMGNTANVDALMRENIQSAQDQLSALRDQLPVNFNPMGNSDLEMPDFRPNTQKTKPFKERLEYGLNLQSQRSNGFLPSSTDLGLSIGYKLNDKSTAGIGASYRWGWGQDIRHIRITHEGIGVRSFVDWQLKGSFYLTGGYERNHNSGFQRWEQLKDVNAWQESGLIGIMKKQQVGKKKATVQLLWDFLSYRQVPQTQAAKVRVGWLF